MVSIDNIKDLDYLIKAITNYKNLLNSNYLNIELMYGNCGYKIDRKDIYFLQFIVDDIKNEDILEIINECEEIDKVLRIGKKLSSLLDLDLVEF